MMTPKEVAEFITGIAEGKRKWSKSPDELWIEREIEQYVQQQIRNYENGVKHIRVFGKIN